MSDNRNKIFAVVVLYRCKLAESAAYRTLLRDGGFGGLMVYDHSPADFGANNSDVPAAAHYVRDEKNSGISKAYNVAAAKARELGFEYVLLLDSDTTFAENAAAVYGGVGEGDVFAPTVRLRDGSPFSPARRRSLRHPKSVALPVGEYSFRTYSCINSGLLVSLDAFEKSGGYNEKTFLDFSDYQFQSRLLQSGIEHFRLIDTVATQDYSNEVRDPAALLARFRLFLQSARACETHSFKEKLSLRLQILSHTLSLTLRTRSLSFIKQFFR